MGTLYIRIIFLKYHEDRRKLLLYTKLKTKKERLKIKQKSIEIIKKKKSSKTSRKRNEIDLNKINYIINNAYNNFDLLF